MTEQERHQLEAMRRNKIPVREIARQLGFCERTIYYELRRGSYMHTCDFWDEKRYSAQKGQQTHNYNQTAKGRPLKIGCDHTYATYIEHKIIVDRYSPAAALAAAKRYNFQTHICVSTLYSYINKRVFLTLTNKHLWDKRRKKQKKDDTEKRIAHPKLPSIENRPAYIGQRSERGHWEMNLIIGKAETSPVLLTLTERYSRQELIFKLPDRKASTIRGVFDQLERQHKDFDQRFKTLTTDNGSEFMEYEKLCRSIHGGSRFQVWYCHSYSAWEKGSVENHNRMIRRFFPKGTDFSKISKKRIAAVQDWMNNYPRKILQWQTPNEAAA
jgi:IS30 family transposase